MWGGADGVGVGGGVALRAPPWIHYCKKFYSSAVADPGFPGGSVPTPGAPIVCFPKNCLKMKEIGPGGRSWRPLRSAGVLFCSDIFSVLF